jgi:crotonobetainyl-CoA:carnitine CoA-transferase CaiB-like acyl-CoA transferase
MNHETAAIGPLDGLKVLDLSWVVAGPLVGRALADAGAAVVRVESSTRPETARLMPPFHGGPGVENSALFGNCNAGKLGLSLDLKQESAREVVRDLAAWADVVVESYAPGRLAAWGLDYASLSREHPELIMLSSSINGQSGPYASLAGYGNVGAALSGFQEAVGWADRVPFGPFGPYTDYVAPRFALATVLAALLSRDETGQGCYIDLSQVESGAYLQQPYLARNAENGAVVQRRGNRDASSAHNAVTRCLDDGRTERFVAISIDGDEQWKAVAAAMARPELAEDPRYATQDARAGAVEDIDRLLEQWTKNLRPEDVETKLQAAGVAAHVAASSKDFCTDPQLAHRGHLVQVPHSIHGTTTVEGPRYLLSETPLRVQQAAPCYGQHNYFVLSELLGYDQTKIEKLESKGILV